MTGKPSSGVLRILTALIGAPLLLGSAWLGGWAFSAVMAGIALLAQIELFRLMHATGAPAGGPLAWVAGVLVVLAPMVPTLLPAAGLLVLIALGLHTFRIRGVPFLLGASGTVFGIVYPAGFLACLVALRLQPDGFVLVLAAFLLVWVADSAAYYAGRTFGSRKLAPAISPAKTWEGAIGGLIGAAIAATGFVLWSGLDWHPAHWYAWAAVAGIVGPVGDLFESSLKRAAGAKDSASLLPGHGGFLDRFDAVAFVAPVLYAYVHFVIAG